MLARYSLFLLCTSLASAQSFNIDLVGSTCSAVPSDGYGAAANQPGRWNAVDETTQSLPLLDLFGNTQGVHFSVGQGNHQPGGLCTGTFCSAWPVGDHRDLYWDRLGHVSSSSILVWADGLSAGNYDIYLYAHAPLNAQVQAIVSPGGQSLVIGGSCPGANPHLQGVTYDVFSVTIAAGEQLLIEALEISPTGLPGSINGIQIVKTDPVDGINYCTSTVNTTGFAATISATGSSSYSANDLTLTAGPVPAGQPAQFMMGANDVEVPFGHGYLCVSSQIHRFPILTIGSDLTAAQLIDNTTTAIQPGSTWYFQLYYRDPAAGAPYFNLSDGLEVYFRL